MNRKQLITGVAVVAALGVVAVFFLFNSLLPMQSSQPAAAPSGAGLTVQDMTVGTGATAEPGDVLVMQYTGKLQDGTVFDTSVGKPANGIVSCPPGTQTGLCFTLGAGQVIPGWDMGLQGMKVGGKRLLIIPSNLAYGAQNVTDQTGKVVIPANSTLVFEVDLLGVAPASTTPTAPEGPSAN